MSQFSLTSSELSKYKIRLEEIRSDVMCAIKQLSGKKPIFVVHIPAGYPRQKPVKSKVSGNLIDACLSARKKFKEKNGNDPYREDFTDKLHVFVCLGKSKNLIGIATRDCMDILESLRNPQPFTTDDFVYDKGIYGPGQMPNFWFA